MSTPDPQVPPTTAPGADPTASTTPDRSRPPRSGGARLALLAAGVAVVLALISTVLSWRAADKADEALDKLTNAVSSASAPAAADRAPTSEPPGEEPATDLPEPTASGAPKLNPSTRYEPRYSGVTMKVPTGSGCSDTVYIDLDEPRVQTGSGVAELEFHKPCGDGTPYLNLTSGVQASEVGSDSVTPVECGDKIKLSPIAPEEQPLRRGQVYCITTSFDDARASATSWKMVIVTVTAMPQDGSVTFNASGWDIPS